MITKPSPIRQIMKMASEKNIINMGLDPEEIISYGGGWVGHHAPEGFRESYDDICTDRETFHESGKYSPTLGFPECRHAIAAMEKALFGVELEEDNIIVGQSSTQLTHDIVITLADPGDAILLLDPTYANYMGQIELTLPGSELVWLPVLDPETWQYIPDTDALTDRLAQTVAEKNPKMVIVPSPDNPSSQVMPHRVMHDCLEICEDAGAFLVIDHAYKTQVFEHQPAYYSWNPNDYPHLITIHSNSKWCRGLGRRLGWIEAHPDVIDGMERTQQCSILCPDTLHQMAMTRYIEDGLADGSLPEYIEQSRRAYHTAAVITVKEIEQLLGMPHLKPQGGLYTLMQVNEDGDAFVKRVLENTGVLFIPGKGFGTTLAAGVRISYGPHVENTDIIREGFERVAGYLETGRSNY
jgi:aspartate/methionine/tyrosine aminotransferase